MTLWRQSVADMMRSALRVTRMALLAAPIVVTIMDRFVDVGSVVGVSMQVRPPTVPVATVLTVMAVHASTAGAEPTARGWA